jgi:hypothetical protein
MKRVKLYLLFSVGLGSVRCSGTLLPILSLVPKRIVRHVTGVPHGCVSSIAGKQGQANALLRYNNRIGLKINWVCEKMENLA